MTRKQHASFFFPVNMTWIIRALRREIFPRIICTTNWQRVKKEREECQGAKRCIVQSCSQCIIIFLSEIFYKNPNSGGEKLYYMDFTFNARERLCSFNILKLYFGDASRCAVSLFPKCNSPNGAMHFLVSSPKAKRSKASFSFFTQFYLSLPEKMEV